MNNFRQAPVALASCLILGTAASAAPPTATGASPVLKQYCVQCHGKSSPMGGVSIEQLNLEQFTQDNFQHWEKVVNVLEQKSMPPPKMPQPAEAQRTAAVQWIRARMSDFAAKHAGDPGRVTVRRLTAGEYAYTISDLTGVAYKVERDFVADSVGGEGFASFGDVQFMGDANLERYLKEAKKVADHAVVGAGKLGFYSDPGKMGFELSAISRIQNIYRAYGFRAASGEGGKPYGLERYSKALFAAWQYKHRQALGEPAATLTTFAKREQLSPPFVQHIWSVLTQPSPAFPTSEIVERWRNLPQPTAVSRQQASAAARAGSDEIQKFLFNWPRVLLGAGGAAEGGQGDERALILTDETVNAVTKHRFRFLARGRRQQKTTRVYLTSVSMNPNAKDKPSVTWKNGTVRFRKADRSATQDQPLAVAMDEASRARLGLPATIDPAAAKLIEFTTSENANVYFDIPTPEGIFGMEVSLEGEIGPGEHGDAVMRCTISEFEEVSKGRPSSALLGYPKSESYKQWKANVLVFAGALPQTSHGEPTPSDRDPIPPPYNTDYNQPERDSYHTKVKYYRDDRFLVEKVLDAPARLELDQAWNDLLASFDYHDEILHFVGEKFKVDLTKKSIAELTPAQIEALPAEPKKYVRALRTEYDAVQKAQMSARPGHIDDVIQFAEKAWRRPLTPVEKDRLRGFYTRSREVEKFDHVKAIRAVIARVLVSPAFLYRFEPPSQLAAGRTLGNSELAGRLSYFLWSSVPDVELRRAAAAGELATSAGMEKQVKRMLADPRARRMATEFFGQWLGFYRFDEYNGVDTSRYPEFTPDLKSAMYEEAVSFFEHIVRKDRPVKELFNADYTFLNQTLAKHYGVTKKITAENHMEQVDGANAFQRGGMLRLGAVLTVTSAPLRTSPVKRGDWVLRRILGTPTPPPPPDAGSIPADEKEFGGLSLKDKLQQHQRNATCAGCHSRIDPMGFPLERYDAVGRVRQTYPDGKPVEDTVDMAGGTQIKGTDGLVAYLQSQEPQVMKTLSRKLLGYSLGRTIIASDQPLIDAMIAKGANASFSQLVLDIANSKQFRTRREQPAPVAVPQRASRPAAKSTQEGGL